MKETHATCNTTRPPTSRDQNSAFLHTHTNNTQHTHHTHIHTSHTQKLFINTVTPNLEDTIHDEKNVFAQVALVKVRARAGMGIA